MAAQDSKRPVKIERMPDGRHAVMGADGSVLGMHNSPFSAARQVHEYYGPVSQPTAATPDGDGDEPAEAQGMDAVQPLGGAGEPDQQAAAAMRGTESAMHKPNIPHPGKKKPGIPRPQIKRPK